MFKIDISNHPYFNDITRKASVIGLTFTEEKKKEITLKLYIHHYLDGVEFTDLNTDLVLLLDNSKEYPDGQGGTIGNYDAFILQAEMGQQFSVMIANGVAAVDADDTINGKCKYTEPSV